MIRDTLLGSYTVVKCTHLHILLTPIYCPMDLASTAVLSSPESIISLLSIYYELGLELRLL